MVDDPFLLALKAGLIPLLPPGSVVLIAVSGGADSLALLSGWVRLAPERADTLHVASFDHRLREDSADDVRFVEQIARSFDLPCHLGQAKSGEIAAAGSIEENARDARYAFLRATAHSIGARFVATGHTADDQVETVLHAVIRGAGVQGLGGMRASRSLDEDVLLVRPMLAIPRSEGERFLERIGLTARIDPTNRDVGFTRNRIRHELLPMIRERFNPRVDDALLRLSRIAAETSAYLQREADRLLQQVTLAEDKCSGTFDLEALRLADRTLVLEAFRLFLKRKGWPRQRIGMAELERMAALIDAAAPRRWDLPDGLRVERRAKPFKALVLIRDNAE